MSYIDSDTMSLPFYFLFLLFLCTCSADNPLGNFCFPDRNVSSSSRTSANIDLVVSELVSKTPSTGFTTASFGTHKAKVYGLAQCRGDVGSKDCSACIQNATKQIRQLCPNQVGARIWYNFCFLRYSTENFIGKKDTAYGIYFANDQNVTDSEMFYKKLGALLDEIRPQAVDPKNKGLGKGESKLSASQTLYALVECTRDLSPLLCSQCMDIPVGYFKDVNMCYNRKGCQFLVSTCTARYEFFPFFDLPS